MTKNRILLSLPVCVLIALLAAFLFVTPAFAQDELPPEVVPTEAPAEVLPTEAAPVEVVPTEAAPAEVLPTEVAPAEELPVEAAPVEEAPADEPGLAEALDDASVVLANSDGEPVSLANKAAGGDPYFWVGTTKYTFLNGDPTDLDDLCLGVLNCQESLTPIFAALDSMSTNHFSPLNGLLYIEEDTYNEGLIDINGLNFVGLKGIQGAGLAEYTIINGSFYIHNFSNGFSLSNLTVNNTGDSNSSAIRIADNIGTIKLTDVNTQATGEDSSGILIDYSFANKSPVEFNRVEANGNGFMGASITNASSVKIINSSFNDNLSFYNNGTGSYVCESWNSTWSCTSWKPKHMALSIVAWGPVTLNGVSASNNQGDGAVIYDGINQSGTVSIKNGVFDQNEGDGLRIFGSTVSMENIETVNNNGYGINTLASSSFTGIMLTAHSNVNSGVKVDSCFLFSGGDSICDSTGAGTVTLIHTGTSNNGTNGLEISAKGAVTITEAYAGDNDGDGILIDTSYSTGTPVVTVTGVETPRNASGIFINSRGAVTVKDFITYENDFTGIYIDNTYGTGAVTLAAPTTPSDSGSATGLFNESNDNAINGYEVYSRGAVTITNVNTNNNGEFGGYIDNSTAPAAAAVTINKLGPRSVGNDSNNNGWSSAPIMGRGGLVILSRGAVSISRFSADSNLGVGININNVPSLPTAAGVPVTLTNVLIYSSEADGLLITSRGAVSLTQVTADFNQGVGAQIYNIPSGTLPAVAVTVTDSEFWGNIDYDGSSDEHGLDIQSKGLITLKNVTAGENDGYGAYLRNTSGSAGVTINSITGSGNIFRNNFDDGLHIETNGAVTLTNIYASNNVYWDSGSVVAGGYGVYINNAGGTAAVSIKQVSGFDSWSDGWMQGNTFSNNAEDGLYINSRGAVTVAFYQARGNQGTGIEIESSGGTGAVTVTGHSDYWDNLVENQDGYGLKITSKGNITVTKVNAHRNPGGGAWLVNTAGSGNVTLTDAYFEENDGNGLYIRSNGTVSWKNGSANWNHGLGADIQNFGAGKAVTVTNVNTNSNDMTGLYIISKGAVTITDSQADSNSPNGSSTAYGEWITDTLRDGQTWWFEGEAGDEVTIEVSSMRFFPWIDLLDLNGGYVKWVTDGDDGDEDGTATLTFTLVDAGWYEIRLGSGNTWNGNGYEMKLYEGAEPDPADWVTPDYSANGMYVDNRGGTGAVTITNASNRWNSNNSGTNVVVLSKGAVTLKNMEMNDSADGGLKVQNYDSLLAGTPGVTITNVDFLNNDGDAAYIETEGAVVVNGSGADNNWGRGYYVDNRNFTSALSPVTFTNVWANNYGMRDLGSDSTGITLRSNGAVTFTTVSASGNGGNGIDIDTKGAVLFNGADATDNSGMGAKVITTLGAFTLNAPVDGINFFGNNDLEGLHVEAGGKITVTRIQANENGRDDVGDPINNEANGIYLQSTNTAGTMPIVLTEVTTNHNSKDGVKVSTRGAVTVTTLVTNGNDGYGLFIDQTGATDSLKPIILNKIFASNNLEDGVWVDAMGSITTNFVEARSNQRTGLNLFNDNSYLNGVATVYSTGTITMLNTLGQNLFVMNGGSWVYNVGLDEWEWIANGGVGVNLQSYGVVTVNQLEAVYNGGEGLVVFNTNTNPAILVKPVVTLNNVISRENRVAGIYAESTGVITINNSWSANNRGYGIRIVSNNAVNINNTASLMNDWAGIYAKSNAGAPIFKLTGSAWFGNLRSPKIGDPNLNLWLDGGWVLQVL